VLRELHPSVLTGLDLSSESVDLNDILPSKPITNLPAPNCIEFVGRKREFDWLFQHLLHSSSVRLLVVTGIGGIGKSELALAVAHKFLNEHMKLPAENRFEAIIWLSGKKEVLGIDEKPIVASLHICRTIEDVYSEIATTLERTDIKDASTYREQEKLIERLLRLHRVLIIVDEIESMSDGRVDTFVRNIPERSKAVVTTSEWNHDPRNIVAIKRLEEMTFREVRGIYKAAMAGEAPITLAQQRAIFEFTNGIPLPIVIALAKMRAYETFMQVMDWLQNPSSRLYQHMMKEQIDAVSKHHPDAWLLLLACSFFGRESGGSREALSSMTRLTEHRCNDGLSLLQQFSLVKQNKEGTFWMIPMMQRYMQAHLHSSTHSKLFEERWRELSFYHPFPTTSSHYLFTLVSHYNLVWGRFLYALMR